MKSLLAAALATLGLTLPAAAQQTAPPFTWGTAVVCAYNQSLPVLATGHFGYVQCDNHGQVLTTATFSGTVSTSGFTPSPAYSSPLTVGATSSRVALPSGSTIIVYNTGANAAYVQLGDATVTATTSNDYIPANSGLAFTVGTATYLAAIETAGATTLNISGGSGLPSGWGGGGGSGGSSGGNVSVVAPVGHATADTSAVSIVPSATASFPVTASSLPLPTGAATSALQTTGNTALSTINTTLGSPMQNTGGSVTANLGTLNGAATAANQTTGNNALTTINTTLGTPMQNSGGSVTANAGTNLNTSLLATDAHLTALGTGALATDAHLTALGTSALATDAHLTAVEKTATSTGSASSVQVEGIAGGTAIPVSGSFSLAGFAPGAYVSPMAVTSVSSRTALPAGATVVVYNTGSNNAYVTIGNTSVVATTSNDVVYPNCWISYSVGANVDIAAITSSSTTSLNLAGGTGIPSGGCAAVLTGASTVTANQGTAGGAAWPVSLSALPALAAGSATIGAVTQASAPWQVQSNSANLATDAHLTALGTTSLATDAHLTAFTTANHTDLGTLNTTLGTPMQNTGGSVTANAGTNLNTSLLATESSLTSFSSANHTDLGQLHTDVTSPIPAQTSGAAVGIGAIKLCDQASTANPLTPCATISASNALKVDGSAITQPVSISGNQAVNVAQINAHTVLEGTGAQGSGSQRVTVAQDTATIAGSPPGTAGSASPNVVTVQGIASMTPILSNISDGTNAAAIKAASTAAVAADKALVVAQSPNGRDPCTYGTRVNYALSKNNTTASEIIAASGSTKIYICSIALVAAAADVVNFIYGTGTNCATSPNPLIGSVTAGNGMSLAANGGFTLGNGAGTVAQTPASQAVCILKTAAVYDSGVITYVQQ